MKLTTFQLAGFERFYPKNRPSRPVAQSKQSSKGKPCIRNFSTGVYSVLCNIICDVQRHYWLLQARMLSQRSSLGGTMHRASTSCSSF